MSPLPSGTPQSIHQALSSSMPNSPPAQPINVNDPDLYRLLNDVVPLAESEVYSWFPEPEYDPHFESEDGELSEEDYDEDIPEDESMADDMDMDDPSWGQGGMELDELDQSPATVPEYRQTKQPKLADPDTSMERRQSRLLWSQNFFFYSK